MSIPAAYTEWSATYDSDRNLTRDLDEEVTHKILGPLRCRMILEIGCGTGKHTGWLATIGEHVLALDFSIAMIERAQEKHRSGRIRFTAADLTQSWPCQDECADLVVCNLVLEHIQDISFVFDQAARVLAADSKFLVSELHPFRQYQGTKANFQRGGNKIEIPAFTHHVSEFLNAARQNGFALEHLGEWWHPQDEGKPPRLISFLFDKAR